MDNQEERVGLQSVPKHTIYPGLEQHWEELNFPIDHHQLRNLLGQALTQIEAMNLQPASEKASKAIFTQMFWRWFDEVMENSITSAPAIDSMPCIAPIKVVECPCDDSKVGNRCSVCAVPQYVKLVRMVDAKANRPTSSSNIPTDSSSTYGRPQDSITPTSN